MEGIGSMITNTEGMKIALDIVLVLLGTCAMLLFKRMSDDIRKLTTSVETLNNGMARVVTRQEDHGRRLDRLEGDG